MRGYFGIGVEGISKPMNLGNLVRSGHAFGASFIFTVDGALRRDPKSDTSKTSEQVPVFHYPSVDELQLPRGCDLVGIELLDDAIDLPTFCHPAQCAYVLGAERGALSTAILERCRHVVRIPTSFCINLATAGAIVMYDRVRTIGRFAPRPIWPGGAIEPVEPHVHGAPLARRFRRIDPTEAQRGLDDDTFDPHTTHVGSQRRKDARSRD